MLTIKKDKIIELVEKLAKERSIIAPELLPNGDLLYSYLNDTFGISLETYKIPVLSAKEFFFSDEEELFSFEYSKDRDIILNPPEYPKEQVFIGIRSCDLKGVRFIEKFFREPFKDETVTKKVENTIFISIGCNQPAKSCFCVCCDGGPFITEGGDIQLVDLGNKYLIDIFTPKGKELITPYSELFEQASDDDFNKKTEVIEAVDKKFTQRSYMSGGVKSISLGKVPEEVLELLNYTCLSCGSCTFVCPTCTCFNVYDRRNTNGGNRIRAWDSCNYSGFTREVSGHNPRHDAKERLQRRFFHKMSYQCLLKNGRIGCVGCGRCVISCPSNLDISSFVTSIREVKNENAFR
ncbi:4Fe-4S dicluster domain-containing protein [bacterium]|nr:4Fe-4S dicluster domain-containing protein [bacterium]